MSTKPECEATSARSFKKISVAFYLRTLWYLRNTKPVIEELLSRGHSVTIISVIHDDDYMADVELSRLAERYPGRLILNRMAKAMHRRKLDRVLIINQIISLALDRLHFNGPFFDDKPTLRHRGCAKSEGRLLDILNLLVFRRGPGYRAMRWLFEAVLMAMPANKALAKILKNHRPDVLIATPLIDVGYGEADFVRTATLLSIPSVFFVHSWDNLSSKSRLALFPTATVLWNRFQVAELEHFHGGRGKRVHVCGAPCYDDWLNQTPSTDREAFLAAIGLDPASRTIVFVGSATFRPPYGSHEEADFVHDWIKALRADKSELRTANILLRPHPKRFAEFAEVAATFDTRVVAWPPRGENPLGGDARANYFDTLWHADAVVGINTSAFIEAALLAKPVFTVLDPRFRSSQLDTFHFAYLLDGPDGNMVRAHTTLDEHVRAVELALKDEDTGAAHRRAALAFTRGEQKGSAAVQVANAVEAEAGQRLPPHPASIKRIVGKLAWCLVVKRLLAWNTNRLAKLAWRRAA